MSGMMRTADRVSEIRALARWRDEYETPPVNVVTDECPHDHRPCPFDVSFCCTAFRAEAEWRLRMVDTALLERRIGDTVEATATLLFEALCIDADGAEVRETLRLCTWARP